MQVQAYLNTAMQTTSSTRVYNDILLHRSIHDYIPRSWAVHSAFNGGYQYQYQN